jgi:putative membrane protein
MIVRPQSPSIISLLFSRQGSIVAEVWRPILFTVLIAMMVTWTHGHLYHFKVTLTVIPFSLIGLTLAIFLGFRNRISYDRFWEGRRLWGELLIVSRNLGRQTLSLPHDVPREQQRALIQKLAAFAYILRHHLRGTDPGDDIDALLSANEKTQVLQSHNRPNVMLRILGMHYSALCHRQRALPPVLLCNIDQQITRLSYVLGGCERILFTPIPYAYILLLHRTVHLYCFLLPFGLIDTVGLLTPLVVAIVAYTFFCLDALGGQIENPFDMEPNDLPLEALSNAIESNLRELLEEPPLPDKMPDGNGVLM